jgi:dienelactone hydrolase
MKTCARIASIAAALCTACGTGSGPTGDADGPDADSTPADADLDAAPDGFDADDAEPDAEVDAEADAEVDADISEPATTSLCGGQSLFYELPENPAAVGPWPVSSRTVQVAGLTVEVWYPAVRGSEAGLDVHVYDLREHLPDDGADVAPSESLMQRCPCYRDLPIDDVHGPYPLIVFAHGFSGFRGQSLEFVTHWASRGFVVVAADHPSLGLQTFLEDGLTGIAFDMVFGGGLGTMLGDCDLGDAGGQRAEVVSVLDALHEPTGDLAFLAGRIDTTRIGAAGHSAGAAAVAALSQYPGVQVVVPMAFGGVCDGSHVRSSLVMGGMDDGITPYSWQQGGYDDSPRPKRLVGLADAGHMAFTSFCPIGADEGGILAAARNAGVEFDPIFYAIIEPLSSDGCGEAALAPEVGWEVTSYATAAAFEEVLLCLPERGIQLSQVWRLYPDAVGEYLEAH